MKTRTTAGRRRPLAFADAIRVKSAQNWLALGVVEEAQRELSRLGRRAASHPQALEIFYQLHSFLARHSI